MKKISRITRQNAVLLTSASTLVLLAGCDFTDMKNPFSPDRPPQVVEGERRQPIYNQQMMRRMQSKAAKESMMVTPADNAEWQAPAPAAAAPVPVPPPAAAAPMPVPPPAAAPAMPPQSAITPPPADAFTTTAPRGAMPVAAAPVQAAPMPAASVQAAPVQSMPVQPMPVAAAPMRAEPVTPPAPAEELASISSRPQAPAKEEGSFFSRFFSNNETSESENLPPWKMRDGVQPDYVEPATARAESAPAQEMAAAENAPAWADQWIGKQAPAVGAPMDAERNAPYPTFGSVPPRPDDFETARGSSKQALQELEDARNRADATRAALAAEPSQAYKATPVEMPVEPQASAPVQDSEPMRAEPSYPGSGPRRGVDIMTQEEWEALKRQQPGYMPPQDSPALEQRGSLGEPEGHLPVSGVKTSVGESASSEPPPTETPSFLARVFGSLNTEHADTNTPSATASDLPEPSQLVNIKATAAENSTLTLPEPMLEAALSQEAKPQPEAAAEPKQLWLLPPAAEARPEPAQARAETLKLAQAEPMDESGGDWLLALISQSKESEAREKAETIKFAQAAAKEAEERAARYEAETAASPEKQLLAQLSAAPILPPKDEPAKARKAVKAAPQEPTHEVQLFAAAPEAPAQLTFSEAAPAPQGSEALKLTLPEPVAETPAPPPQETAAAQPAAPSWLTDLFAAHAEAHEPETPRQVIFGTQLATSASQAAEPAEPAPAAEPVMAETPAQPPVQLAEALPAAEPSAEPVNRAIAERLARLEAQKAAKLAKKTKGKSTALAKKKAKEPILAKVDAPAPLKAEPQTAKAPETAQPHSPAPLPQPELLAQASAPVAEPAAALSEPANLATPPQSVLAALPEPVAEAPTPAEEAHTAAASQPAPILQTEAEISKPAWFSSMFDGNGKQAEAKTAAAGTAAVNESAATGNTLSTAQNSASAAEATALAEVKTGKAAGEETSKLPSLSSVAAPIAQVLTGEAALAAGAASALPSPKILQEIKMLPASRYTARIRGGGLQDSH